MLPLLLSGVWLAVSKSNEYNLCIKILRPPFLRAPTHLHFIQETRKIASLHFFVHRHICILYRRREKSRLYISSCTDTFTFYPGDAKNRVSTFLRARHICILSRRREKSRLYISSCTDTFAFIQETRKIASLHFFVPRHIYIYPGEAKNRVSTYPPRCNRLDYTKTLHNNFLRFLLGKFKNNGYLCRNYLKSPRYKTRKLLTHNELHSQQP